MRSPIIFPLTLVSSVPGATLTSGLTYACSFQAACACNRSFVMPNNMSQPLPSRPRTTFIRITDGIQRGQQQLVSYPVSPLLRVCVWGTSEGINKCAIEGVESRTPLSSPIPFTRLPQIESEAAVLLRSSSLRTGAFFTWGVSLRSTAVQFVGSGRVKKVQGIKKYTDILVI